tara:strand:+ start:604 stop:1677 length:1074 start_codon:yes stop_codon:yes gene_type:complete
MDLDTYFIKKSIVNWYDSNKRDLPWRILPAKKSELPYQVLVSEIMLQQTTVATVKKKYLNFMSLWPNIDSLSRSPKSQILRFWSGLGYYRRAINLHKCAKIIKKEFDSKVPKNEKDLLSLPGIGKYTASAILAIAYNQPIIAIDANVQRVVTRIYGLTSPVSEIRKQIESYAKNFVYKDRPGDMVQSLMDFGSIICKPQNPTCKKCFLNKRCVSFKKKLTNIIPLIKKIPFHEKPIRYAYAYLIFNKKNNVFLRKRLPTGMLPSMMEVPTSEWLNRPPKVTEIKKFSPIQLQYRKVGKPIIYPFTHFRLKVFVLVGFSNRKKLKNGNWYSLKRVNSLELPTVMKKIIFFSIKSKLLN